MLNVQKIIETFVNSQDVLLTFLPGYQFLTNNQESTIAMNNDTDFKKPINYVVPLDL